MGGAPRCKRDNAMLFMGSRKKATLHPDILVLYKLTIAIFRIIVRKKEYYPKISRFFQIMSRILDPRIPANRNSG